MRLPKTAGRHAAPLALLLALVSIAFAPRAAHAQDAQTYSEHRTDSGAVIVFKEDLTTGSTLGTNGATLRPPSAAFRTGLARPRLNFVSEMLKSVESL